MVQLVVGNKGKGKTTYLLDKVNTEVQKVSGSIVYLDKNTKHMYELNNKIRLIDVSYYMVETLMNLLVLSAELFPRIMIWNRYTLTTF